MENQFPYTTLLDIRYAHQELIDVPDIVNSVRDKWFNQTLTKVNDSVVRIGIVEGEYHWHKHDKDHRTITLDPWQGFTISRGVMHRTRALTKTVMLMVETSEIRPTGD